MMRTLAFTFVVRLAVPAVLCVSACGCVWLPGNYRPANGAMRPEEKVGDSDRKLVHPGRSTRENVVSALGPPTQLTPDDRHYVYTYYVAKGWWIWPIWLVFQPEEDARYLHLAFDDAGVLTHYKVFADWVELDRAAGRGRLVARRLLMRQRRAATQPAVGSGDGP